MHLSVEIPAFSKITNKNLKVSSGVNLVLGIRDSKKKSKICKNLRLFVIFYKLLHDLR